MTIPDPVVIFAETLSVSSILIEWDAVVEIDGYTLERSTDQTNWTTIAQLTEFQTIYLDSGLLNETTYYYRITCYNKCGTSNPSVASAITDCSAPAAPFSLTTEKLSELVVSVNWLDSSNSSAYVVERSVLPNSGFSVIGITDVGETNFTDNIGIEDCFYYRVKAIRCNSESSYVTTNSAICGECNAPSAPIGLIAVAVSDVKINLSWSAPAGVVDDYVIKRNGITIGTSTVTSFSQENLSPDTQYCYTVIARNECGSSEESNEACATTDGSAECDTPEQTFAWSFSQVPEPGYYIGQASSGIYLRHSDSQSIDVTNVAVSHIRFEDSDLDDVLLLIPYGTSVVQTYDAGSGSGFDDNGRGATTFTFQSPAIVIGNTYGNFINSAGGNVRQSTQKTFVQKNGATTVHTYVIQEGSPGGPGVNGSGHTSDFAANGFVTANFSEGLSVALLDSLGFIYHDPTTGKNLFRFRMAHVVSGRGHLRIGAMTCSVSEPSSSSCSAATSVTLSGEVDGSTITLNWSNSSNEIGYSIQRSVDGGDYNNSYAETAANVTTFDDPIDTEHSYCYRIVARGCTVDSNSAASNEYCYEPTLTCDGCCDNIRAIISDGRSYILTNSGECEWTSECGSTLTRHVGYWELIDTNADCVETVPGVSTGINIYNTGESITGGFDNHWSIETANGNGIYTAATQITWSHVIENVFIAAPDNANWIGSNVNGHGWDGEGNDNTRSFRTTVTLSTPVELTGKLSVDNYVITIKVNGVTIINDLYTMGENNGRNFRLYKEFTIPSSAFSVGANTIDFAVYDDHGSAGLLVQWLGASETDCETIFRLNSSATCPESSGWTVYSTECQTEPTVSFECAACPEIIDCPETLRFTLDGTDCIDGEYNFTYNESNERWESDDSYIGCEDGKWILSFHSESGCGGPCDIRFWAPLIGTNCPPEDILSWTYIESDCPSPGEPELTEGREYVECPTVCCDCQFVAVVSGTQDSCDGSPIALDYLGSCIWGDGESSQIFCEDGYWIAEIYLTCGGGCIYTWKAPKVEGEDCPPFTGWEYEPTNMEYCEDAGGDYMILSLEYLYENCNPCPAECDACFDQITVTVENSPVDGEYILTRVGDTCVWEGELEIEGSGTFTARIFCDGNWVFTVEDENEEIYEEFIAEREVDEEDDCPPEEGWDSDEYTASTIEVEGENDGSITLPAGSYCTYTARWHWINGAWVRTVGLIDATPKAEEDNDELSCVNYPTGVMSGGHSDENFVYDDECAGEGNGLYQISTWYVAETTCSNSGDCTAGRFAPTPTLTPCCDAYEIEISGGSGFPLIDGNYTLYYYPCEGTGYAIPPGPYDVNRWFGFVDDWDIILDYSLDTGWTLTFGNSFSSAAFFENSSDSNCPPVNGWTLTSSNAVGTPSATVLGCAPFCSSYENFPETLTLEAPCDDLPPATLTRTSSMLYEGTAMAGLDEIFVTLQYIDGEHRIDYWTPESVHLEIIATRPCSNGPVGTYTVSVESFADFWCGSGFPTTLTVTT